MPLLARKVRNIVVFINSKTEFVFSNELDRVEIASSIPNLFTRASDGFRHNIVIKDDNAHTKYRELLEAFEAARVRGRPMVHCDVYDIKRNANYSVGAYKDVKICWVYNHNASDWMNALPHGTRKIITSGEAKRFPHYRTFFQNPPKLMDLSRAEAGLLAHLSCWSVMESVNVLAPS